MSDSKNETTTPHRLTADELMRASRLVEHLRSGRFTAGSKELDAICIMFLEHADDAVVRAGLVWVPSLTTPTPKGEEWMQRLHASRTDSVSSESEIEVTTTEVVLEVVPAVASDSEESELGQLSQLTREGREELKILAEGIRQQAEARQAKIDEINSILTQSGTGDYTKWFRSQMDSSQNARIHVFLKNLEVLQDGPLERLVKDLRILNEKLQAERESKKAAREAEAAARREAKAETATAADSVEQIETPPVVDQPLPEKSTPKRRRLSAKEARKASKGK